ncbi:thiol-disulfide oxidoreductase DCC family protein [Pseudoclavibacter sp. 13-3]|uniref:thiol-disulfide oxidoreductase DCC family protein n=1 Tax=Pseudoclavibacter sp. 13-3 TaxID=2901228 RepID=UPI001E288710|nr:DCC1-like thiol-disulfide oxidoreductase family protein [Pseudoclavibacter sp. 13-3]MCD7100840.1 DUF393 domain-containing protein [Pseudoclavibacter sp. 13-3]
MNVAPAALPDLASIPALEPLAHADTILVFDGACEFCRRCIDTLQRVDRHDRVYCVPSQNLPVREALRLSADEAAESVWLSVRLPSGRWRRCSGAAAVNSALDIALGSRVLRTIYHLPGVARLQEHLYRRVADSRGPSCRLPDEPVSISKESESR